MGDLAPPPRRRDRSWIAALLGYGEFLIDAAVAIALTVGGVILLGVVLYHFVRGLGRDPLTGLVLELLNGLLRSSGTTATMVASRSARP